MAQRVRTDWVLFWVVVVLVCFGLVMVYSASSVVAQQKYGSSFYYIYRQLAWAVAGFVAMMLLKRLRLPPAQQPGLRFLPASFWCCRCWWRSISWTAGRPLAAHRPLGIQPSEFAKPALILFLAYFVAERAKKINNRRTLAGGLLTSACSLSP